MNHTVPSLRTAFTGMSFDRLGEKRDDRHWVESMARSPQSNFLCLDDALNLAVDATTRVPIIQHAQGYESGSRWPVSSFLGQGDGHYWFAQRVGAQAPEWQHASVDWIGLRVAGASQPAFIAGLYAYARGLLYWHKATRYCSQCGAPLVFWGGGHRGECTRASCGALHFPRTDPAIITIVEYQGRCLLGRQASWEDHRYSTLAGFVEPGETLEAAVAREVHEEAGIDVVSCRYFSSQPWPFPRSLMLGFTATAGNDVICLRDGELAAARWFTPTDIVQGLADGTLILPPAMSISWQLIAAWLKRRADIDLAALTT